MVTSKLDLGDEVEQATEIVEVTGSQAPAPHAYGGFVQGQVVQQSPFGVVAGLPQAPAFGAAAQPPMYQQATPPNGQQPALYAHLSFGLAIHHPIAHGLVIHRSVAHGGATGLQANDRLVCDSQDTFLQASLGPNTKFVARIHQHYLIAAPRTWVVRGVITIVPLPIGTRVHSYVRAQYIVRYLDEMTFDPGELFEETSFYVGMTPPPLVVLVHDLLDNLYC